MYTLYTIYCVLCTVVHTYKYCIRVAYMYMRACDWVNHFRIRICICCLQIINNIKELYTCNYPLLLHQY